MTLSRSPEPRFFMEMALRLAAEAMDRGEFPIAAVLVLDDRIIAQGTASEKSERRFLGHAELIALEAADRMGLTLQQRRSARLFCTLEPCLMCMGAAMSFFLGEIIYALESPGDGAVDLVRSWGRIESHLPGYQAPQVTGGLLRQQSIHLFQEYLHRQPPGPMRDWAETLARL